jgi:hypothetical protein
MVCGVKINAKLPLTLLKDLLQHVRDFDVCHVDRVDLQIQIEAPELSGNQVEALLDRVRPPFAYRTTICTKEGKHVRSKVRG